MWHGGLDRSGMTVDALEDSHLDVVETPAAHRRLRLLLALRERYRFRRCFERTADMGYARPRRAGVGRSSATVRLASPHLMTRNTDELGPGDRDDVVGPGLFAIPPDVRLLLSQQFSKLPSDRIPGHGLPLDVDHQLSMNVPQFRCGDPPSSAVRPLKRSKEQLGMLSRRVPLKVGWLPTRYRFGTGSVRLGTASDRSGIGSVPVWRRAASGNSTGYFARR